ncbi:MAG: glycosyltransferase family 9 protein [Bacteriovoracia bacterium]
MSKKISAKPAQRPTFNRNTRVLIIHQQAIGDWLVAIPGLFALSKHVGPIDILASPIASEFLSLLPFVNLVTVEQAKNTNYDLLIDFQDTFTTWQRATLPHLFIASWRVGVRRQGFIPWKLNDAVEKDLSSMHEHAWRLFEVAIHKTLDRTSFVWPTAASPSNFISKDKDFTVCIHVHNKNAFKVWPNNHWIQLVSILYAEAVNRNKTIQFVFTGIQQEQKKTAELVAGLPELVQKSCVDLSGKCKAVDFIEIVRACNLVISVDTSIFHLGALVQTQSLGLFGPTLLNYWGPWSSYQKAISLLLECRPTEDLKRTLALKDRCCTKVENVCMTGIEPSRVSGEAITILLKDYEVRHVHTRPDPTL